MGAKRRRKVAAVPRGLKSSVVSTPTAVTDSSGVSEAWLKLTAGKTHTGVQRARAPIDGKTPSRTALNLDCGCEGSWLRLPAKDGHGYFERFIPDKSCIAHAEKDQPLHELSREERKWHYPEGRCHHCGVRGPEQEEHAWFCYWWNGPGRDSAPF